MKRKPSNTAEAAVRAAVNAAKPPLQPPAHCRLREGDEPFWRDVISARARDEWTEADLILGVQLARCMQDIEREQEKLNTEGSVITNERGTLMGNPRHTVLEQLARRETMMMRSLRMAGRVVADTRDLVTARAQERKATRTSKAIEEEDLLA